MTTARARAAATAGARRDRPSDATDAPAELAAAARRTPVEARLIAAGARIPEPDDAVDDEVTVAEAQVAEERAARAKRTRTADPADAVLDGAPTPDTP